MNIIRLASSIFVTLILWLGFESVLAFIIAKHGIIRHNNNPIIISKHDNTFHQRASSSSRPFHEACKIRTNYHQRTKMGDESHPDKFDRTRTVRKERNGNDRVMDSQRRTIWIKSTIQIFSVATLGTVITSLAKKASASASSDKKIKSRTDGYMVQKSEQEWKEALSPMQYYILRNGGTEPPGYSVLEKENRHGVYQCAGCSTPLFRSEDKFNSGTGWPSFARAIGNVEIENVNIITANLVGAELRCQTCGGHLGDVFSDGYLFVGTEAFVTGKRYCIDGAALMFYPTDDINHPINGDQPKIIKKNQLPNVFDLPIINPRSRDEA